MRSTHVRRGEQDDDQTLDKRPSKAHKDKKLVHKRTRPLNTAVPQPEPQRIKMGDHPGGKRAWSAPPVA